VIEVNFLSNNLRISDGTKLGKKLFQNLASLMEFGQIDLSLICQSWASILRNEGTSFNSLIGVCLYLDAIQSNRSRCVQL